MYLEGGFHTKPEVVISANTFQYNDREIYSDEFRPPAKEKWKHHGEQFDTDLKKAWEAGMRMAESLKEKMG